MLSIIFLSLLTFSFFISGINNDVKNITHVCITSAIAFGFIILKLSNKKLKVPSHFTPLLVFTVILQIYWPFASLRSAPFYYALLFTEGLSLWFIVFNLEKKFVKNLYLMFLIPGLLYFVLYFFSQILNIEILKIATLYFMPGQVISHIQIGDLWALIIVLLVGARFSGINIFSEPLFYMIGVYLLFISSSRSAYIGIIASIFYLLNKKGNTKWFYYLPILLLALVVVYVSGNRSVLLSRPYYLQSLLGFFSHPLGVGMGNFRQISDIGNFSDATHNIFLEALSGVGIFAIPFVYWGYKIFSSIFLNQKNNHFGWVCLFLTLSVLFFIDLSYVIPGMFWLWFISLGMSQREDLLTV